MARITLDCVGLQFRVTSNGPEPVWNALLRRYAPRWAMPTMEVNALRDICLDLRDGDRIGVIGHNGAGKSSLLKVLAGVFPPTAGAIAIEGSASALFDLSLGFEVDATGWQNIEYRGYLQGESRRSVRAKMDAIAEFAELGPQMGVPVRYYSSGMKARLAFAIATAIEPDVLLIDEAFSAGDLPFRHKALRRIRELVLRARLVVSVSHEHELLVDMCDRVIWLDRGQIKEFGAANDVIGRYKSAVGNGHVVARDHAVAA